MVKCSALFFDYVLVETTVEVQYGIISFVHSSSTPFTPLFFLYIYLVPSFLRYNSKLIKSISFKWHSYKDRAAICG
jgi:hypothetical protein